MSVYKGLPVVTLPDNLGGYEMMREEIYKELVEKGLDELAVDFYEESEGLAAEGLVIDVARNYVEIEWLGY